MTTASLSVATPKRRSRILPRVIAVVFMVIATLALLLSLGALIGSWAARGAAVQSVNDVAASADQRLETAQADLETLGQSIAEIEGAVGAANNQVKAVANRVDEAGSALTAVEALLDTKLGPALDSVVDKAARLRDTVAAIESALATLSQIPIIGQLGGGYLEKADEVLIGVQDTAQQVSDVRESVRASRDPSGQPLVAAMGSLSASLSRLESGLNLAGARVTAAKQGLESLQARLPGWASGLASAITVAIVGITVMMLGTAIAMVSVFVQALSLFLGRDVLARWREG